MEPLKTLNQNVIRYSPKPKEEYKASLRGSEYGVATYSLIDTPEMWNLAYLSYDFDAQVLHKDPYFSTHVRRTCQTRLDCTGLDLTGSSPARGMVSYLLRLPAPRFVHLIENHPVLPTLPLFTAYGAGWLNTIKDRAKLCQYEDTPREFILDFSDAKAALRKILKQ